MTQAARLPERTAALPAGPGLILIGAGGHARVLLAALAAAGTPPLAATERDAGLIGSWLTPDGAPLSGAAIDAIPVLADEALPRRAPAGLAVVIGLGVRPTREDAGTSPRRRLHDAFAARGYAMATVLDPSAILRGETRLAAGSQILAGAAIQTGVRIGAGAVVNTRAVVEHDAIVGEHAFIGPGAVLCGSVVIGDGAFVGAGAVVLPGVRIGAGAVVPAGSTQARDLAAPTGR